jgi:chromate transporter
MRNDLVERKKWITENDFENYFGYSQIAPGPIAFQVCLYVGYFRAGILGAMAGGSALVLPSFLIVLVFSIFYQQFKDTYFITAALYGISPVIISIILYSGLQLAGRVFKKDYFLYALFAISVILTAFLKFPIMYVIIGSGIISLLYFSAKKISSSGINSKMSLALFSASLTALINSILTFAGSVKDLVADKLLEMSILFMKVGALTYGSGFVIVGVLNQEVVNNYGYITAKEFIDGLAFGQITPGPVVITSTFIGYLTQGIPGAIVCTVAIFLPTFLIVMILAKFIHRISENFYVKSLIKGANAGAIGSILATAYLLSDEAVKDYITGAFALIALFLLFKYKFNSLYLIIIAGILGIIIYSLDVS